MSSLLLINVPLKARFQSSWGRNHEENLVPTAGFQSFDVDVVLDCNRDIFNNNNFDDDDDKVSFFAEEDTEEETKQSSLLSTSREDEEAKEDFTPDVSLLLLLHFLFDVNNDSESDFTL